MIFLVFYNIQVDQLHLLKHSLYLGGVHPWGALPISFDTLVGAVLDVKYTGLLGGVTVSTRPFLPLVTSPLPRVTLGDDQNFITLVGSFAARTFLSMFWV